MAESNTKPAREKQGALIVAIYLPTKPHTPHPVHSAGLSCANSAKNESTYRYGMSHGSNQEMSLTPKKVSKVKAFDADSSFSIEGMDNGSFAIASNKKELKQLMKSVADVVYYEKKGKLYLNENGEEKGWGAKKVGGLMASFKGKPELSADHFEGMETFDADEAPMQTMFSSKSAAKSAAPNFGCKGAHKMGDYWMVCNDHSDMVMPSDQQTSTNDFSTDFKLYLDGLSDA